MATTRKKVKVVGTTDYIRADTGEVEPMQVISMEDRDFNFHKIWLSHIIQSLDLIGNQKTKLAMFLLDNMDYENKVCLTLRQMAEKSKISLDTVRVTVKTLKEAGFLVAKNLGVYQVNPDIVFKGGTNSRMNILLQYNNAAREAAATKPPVPSPERQLEAAGQTTILDAIREQTATVEPTPIDAHVPKCPKCDKGHLETRNSKNGPFVGCTQYPECRYTENIQRRA